MGRTTPSADWSEAFGPGLDDTGCNIMHIDMDAFFASVEIARDPRLASRPVIVGGLGKRGVVAAASYEARRYGVNSAMPVAVARRKCPHGIYLHPDGEAYSRVSKGVRQIFLAYTPLVEPVSIDEAFLDVSGARRLFGSATHIAELIRSQVREQFGITCTVGIAANKFIAKLASTQAKPDGLAIVPELKVLSFLHPLPITALWGVGKTTEKALTRLGVRTIGDLAALTRANLDRAVGIATSEHLYRLARGEDNRVVQTVRIEKSIGSETTFSTDLSDPDLLKREVLGLCQKTAMRARKAGQRGRTVVVKVRYGDFSTITRSKTLLEPTDVSQEIYAVAVDQILGAAHSPIRLVGVRLEGLVRADGHAIQPRLGEPEHGWRDVERTLDTLNEKFGSVIGPASLLKPLKKEEP